MTATHAAKHNALQQAYLQQAYLQQAQAQQQATAQTGVGAWATAVTTPIWMNPQGCSTTTATTSSLATNVMNLLYSSQGSLAAGTSALVRDTLRLMGECTIADGEPCKITLPDGSIIDVATDGSFAINDKDAKVTYRANRVRDFNPFVNASDKIEAFINFCKIVGVKQGEFMDLPIKHFIAWLIIESARADGEPKPELTLVPDLRKITQPRCRCGRFLSRKLAARRIAFCRPICLEQELEAA